MAPFAIRHQRYSTALGDKMDPNEIADQMEEPWEEEPYQVEEEPYRREARFWDLDNASKYIESLGIDSDPDASRWDGHRAIWVAEGEEIAYWDDTDGWLYIKPASLKNTAGPHIDPYGQYDLGEMEEEMGEDLE